MKFNCLCNIVLFTILFSSSTQAHQLKCEIYDLATGDVLAESAFIPIRSADLRKEEPFWLSLEHDLMRAEFQLGFVDPKSDVLLFQVRTQEVVNSEYAKFLFTTLGLTSGKTYELGRVFTEITGLGDNTMSSCKLTVENENIGDWVRRTFSFF